MKAINESIEGLNSGLDALPKKMYYTDPLQAAYMEREHGVRILLNGREVGIPDWPPLLNDSLTRTQEKAYGLVKVTWGQLPVKLYIHPDSYHIFKPQDGDENIDGWVYNAETKMWDHKIVKYVWNGVKSIDKRNNKPFFMPKVRYVQK